ncbi:hypothetical protein ABZ860_10610 [Microbispora sp. NPDC046973]|uniref:hypothetical protein n=1 Tax=Microbispora sp. NPDC046973 TaxID=3155022 RepID=UPI0033CB972D
MERFDPTGDFTLVGYYPPNLDASVKSLATWNKKDDPSPADCESGLALHELTDQGSLPLTAGGGFCFRTKDNQGGHLGFLRILTAKNADKNGAQVSAVVWGPADGD